ncbi:hypothetical protein [Microcoleus phage My-WqHQDG]|nr:hypothetical protein [Microcoleus phage My-WqHQDG]
MITKEAPSRIDLEAAYCKAAGKYGVWVDLYYDLEHDTPESFQARLIAGFPHWNDYWDTLWDATKEAMYKPSVVFLADTLEEALDIFHQVKGEDSDCWIYACICDLLGNPITDNGLVPNYKDKEITS